MIKEDEETLISALDHMLSNNLGKIILYSKREYSGGGVVEWLTC